MARERCGCYGLGYRNNPASKQDEPKDSNSRKENEIDKDALGRNSDILRAGFYYSTDSLKTRFCRYVNRAIKPLAKKFEITEILFSHCIYIIFNQETMVIVKNNHRNLGT